MMDIDAMEAGPELDALVAEKVMGWKLGNPKWINDCDFNGMIQVRHWEGSRRGNITNTLGWSPSTDIAAAWEVVEKIRARWSNVIMHGANGWGITIGNVDENGNETWISPSTHGDTLPLAICRAALRVF